MGLFEGLMAARRWLEKRGRSWSRRSIAWRNKVYDDQGRALSAREHEVAVLVSSEHASFAVTGSAEHQTVVFGRLFAVRICTHKGCRSSGTILRRERDLSNPLIADEAVDLDYTVCPVARCRRGLDVTSAVQHETFVALVRTTRGLTGKLVEGFSRERVLFYAVHAVLRANSSPMIWSQPAL